MVEVFHCFWEYIPLLMAVACRIFFSIFPPGHGILSGNGKAIIDGDEISLSTGDWLKIAPAAKRQFFASDISGITYICIQVKENSLEHFTAEDAVIG